MTQLRPLGLGLALALGCSRTGGDVEAASSAAVAQPAPLGDRSAQRAATTASGPAAPHGSAAAPLQSAGPVSASGTAGGPAAPAPVVPASAATLTELAVTGDRPAYVAHAKPELMRAIVYLHGVCGDVFAVSSWLNAATRFGTLLAPVGEKACGERRRSWTSNTEQLHARIQRALAAAAQARSGALDVERTILMGYSQGAARAELLASRFPKNYPWLILGGAPTKPSLQKLEQALRVAVLAGEHDASAHLRAGVGELGRAGKAARYFTLPGAGHGEYGPDAERAMAEVLGWVTGQRPD